MESLDKYLSTLRKYWGYDSFRGVQQQIIESIGSGCDTLGLMPTGGGKSITFQVPALTMRGTCVVVTPLIALMCDQVQNLRKRGIKAVAVYSGMSRQEIVTALDNCILGEYSFLYVSPERLQSDLFQRKLHHMRVSFITVDEAHCISQWGYDFRPSYMQVAQIRSIHPHAPILALTASATPDVVEDIQKQLAFREGSRVVSMSFDRPNLTYMVRPTVDKYGELLHILRSVAGSAIVYTRNRQQTHDIAKMLVGEGISATNYHAALAEHEKKLRQQGWLNDTYRVMVATNAFGMGIDKPNVRVVVHMECPDSPEAYFQEAGRAGRDGQTSYAVLLYEHHDGSKLLRRISETYPPIDYIRDVYDHMCYFLQMAMGDGNGVTREFDLGEFCYRFKHFPVVASNALQLLANAGYIDYRKDDEVISRLMFTLQRDELYRLRQQNPLHDELVQLLLRKYTGLFSQHVYIDECLLAHESGQSQQDVYHALKDMNREGILSYIPRKRTDFITFTCRRLPREEIILSRECYAERRNQYERRIHSMVQYATDNGVCRNHFLLSYFGENASCDCGRCDVCCSDKVSDDMFDKIRSHFLSQLTNGPLAPQDVNYDGFRREDYARVVDFLTKEEEVMLDDAQRFVMLQKE